MFSNLDALAAHNVRAPRRRTAKPHAPKHKGDRARHATQRRRHEAACDEASLEIRNALRTY